MKGALSAFESDLKQLELLGVLRSVLSFELVNVGKLPLHGGHRLQVRHWEAMPIGMSTFETSKKSPFVVRERSVDSFEGGTSDNHVTYGVIRLADKRGSHGQIVPFNERDESLLRKIASQCVGPKLNAITFERMATLLQRSLPRINELRTTAVNPWDAIIAIAKDCFEEQLPNRKKHFVISRLIESDKCEIVKRAGALKSVCDGHEFNYDRTLTGYAIQQGETVFLADLKEAERQGRYRPIVEGAIYAMACPLIYRDKVLGTVTILSSHRDLSIEADRPLLEALAGAAAVLLQDLRIGNNSTLLGGASHDLHAVLKHLSGLAELATSRDELRGPIEFLRSLLMVHCCSDQPSSNAFMQSAFVHELDQLIADAKAAVVFLNKQHLVVPIEVQVDRVEEPLRFVREIVLTCVYHLVRNAVEYCSKAGAGTVNIKTGVADKRLYCIISNPIFGDRENVVASFREVSNWVEVDPWAVKSGMGLRIVRRILQWYRFPGTDCGKLDFSTEPSGNSLVTST